jgi:hypothetical protein
MSQERLPQSITEFFHKVSRKNVKFILIFEDDFQNTNPHKK